MNKQQQDFVIEIGQIGKKRKPQKLSLTKLTKLLTERPVGRKAQLNRDREIRSILIGDPQLCEEITRYATNILYYRSVPESIEKAIQRIGEDELIRIVIMFLQKKFFSTETKTKIEMDLHCLKIAASVLYLRNDLINKSEISSHSLILAIIMHDYGKSLMYEYNRVKYFNEVITPLENILDGYKHSVICEKEKEIYHGFDHCSIGRLMISFWGEVDPFMNDVLMYHGNPEEIDTKNYSNEIYLISICDILTSLYKRKLTNNHDLIEDFLTSGYCRVIGLNKHHVTELSNKIFKLSKKDLIDYIVKYKDQK